MLIYYLRGRQRSRGWAIGTEHFGAALIMDHDLTASARAWAMGSASEVRRERCEGPVRAALGVVGQSQADLAAEPKSAPWKITVAA